jgi:anti-sigma factor RsiW
VHLTAEQLDGYRRRSLPARELPAVSDHLAGCPACRASLSGLAASPDASILALAEDEGAVFHLTADEMMALCDSSAANDERLFGETHLRECARCRAEHETLSQFAAGLAKHPAAVHGPVARQRRSWQADLGTKLTEALRTWAAILRGWPGLAAVGTAAMLCIVLWVWSDGNRSRATFLARQDPAARTGGETDAAPAIFIRDGAYRLALGPDNRLVSADRLPAAVQESLAAQLDRVLRAPTATTGMALPPVERKVELLGQGVAPRRAPPSPGVPRLQAPDAGASPSGPPPRWYPFSGEKSAPPKPAEPSAAEIESLRAASAGSRLAFALACVERGFYRQAETELRRLQSENQDSPSASAIIGRILATIPKPARTEP